MDEEQIHQVVITDDLCVKVIPLTHEGYWEFNELDDRTLEIRWVTKSRSSKS